jgi:lipoate-protein ligase A
MHFLDLTLPTPAENLALDEALLLQAEGGASGEVLRLWEWPAPVVVLGAACRLAADVNEAACLADNVPVHRRASGGGTVLWGNGCLLYSLVLAYDRDPALAGVASSYIYILDRIAVALNTLAPGIARAGISDLAVGDRKVSGNAQQRKRDYLLQHGTLLYDFDIGQVGRYLHSPKRQPDYRGGREHLDFLTNLPITEAELKHALRQCWEANIELRTWPEVSVCQLVADKYCQEQWVRRK